MESIFDTFARDRVELSVSYIKRFYVILQDVSFTGDVHQTRSQQR